MTRYIEQLHVVFFKKENLRGKSWWLSVFYSLIIQSFVRKSLLTMLDDLLPASTPSIKQYLQLAVRLFIASSGDYDPLMLKWRASDCLPQRRGISEIENYEAAKLSVRQAQWSSSGVTSSGEFLQHLFEDDGLPISCRADTHLPPEPLLPPSFSSLLQGNADPDSVQPYTCPGEISQNYTWPDFGQDVCIPPQSNSTLVSPQIDSADYVKIVQSRPKPQCWEHGCNGHQFTTFHNLIRHQREKGVQTLKSSCPNCGVEFVRTTAQNGHMANCKRQPDLAN